MDVKVGFFIATMGPGQGGHYRSLRTIVGALRASVDCIVVGIGPNRSAVIDGISDGVYYVRFDGLNVVGAMRRVLEILRRERVDVLNCYDLRVNAFARLASIILRKPMLFTKCGGPNPRRFYPYSDYLVLFSRENFDFFRGHHRYKDAEVHLLPNRTRRILPDADRIRKLRSRLHSPKPTLLIIARFCQPYRDTMVQGVNLAKRLNADGISCQLLIVGIPEDPRVLDEIASLATDPDIHIVYDKQYTHNASELIDVADFVIGTGRSFMEAASRGRVLLTPLAEGPLPLLVTKETFPAVFATNFSPRNRVEGLDAEQNYRSIARSVVDLRYREELSSLAVALFEEHFDVERVVERYKAVFSNMRFRRRFYLADLAFGLLSFWRSKAYFRCRKDKCAEPRR